MRRSALTTEWVALSRSNGIVNISVADRALAQELRVKHCRSGRIERAASKEANNAAILAYGFDILGNVCALCADGVSRQFFRR